MKPRRVERWPETRTAFLPNSHGRATLHRYSHAEVQTVMGSEPGVVLLYRCDVTGELRRWGCEGLK